MHKYLIILLSLLLGSGVAMSAPAEQQWVDSLYAEAETLYASSEYARSMELLQQVIPVVEKAEYTDEDRATCYSLASVLNLRLGDFDQAIDFAEKTLNIDRVSGSKEDVSSSLNTIAGIYQAADQPEKALSYALEAIELERGLNRPAVLAIRLGMASEIYVKLNQAEEGLKAAQEALDIEKPLGNPNGIGIRQSQLAACYDALHQYAEAKTLLEEACRNLREAGNLNSLAISLNQLGNIAYRQGNEREAISCFMESIALSEQLGNNMIASKAHLQLAAALQSTDPYKAIDHLNTYIGLSRDLYSQQTAQSLANYEARYQTAKKQHQVELLEQQLKVRQAWLIALCMLLVAAAVAIFLVRRNALLRTKNTHLLVKSNIMGITELGEMPTIPFTRREREVIAHCAQGLQAKEIADRMGISERTVNAHKNNIFKKLGVQNTVELVIYAKKAGIIS